MNLDSQSIYLVLFAVAALALLALGSFLARRLRPAPARISGSSRMMPLMRAAASAHREARRRRMIIVTVAERAGADAAAWFARSIVSVVPAYRKQGLGVFEKIEDGTQFGEAPEALYIQKRDYKTYLRWAQSMQ
jgi:hypothetical protein